jgi:hypothetical protein
MVQTPGQPFLTVAKLLQAAGKPADFAHHRFGGMADRLTLRRIRIRKPQKHQRGPARKQDLGAFQG